MHKLIGRLVATVGVDRAAAQTVVGMIVRFRRQDDAVESLVPREAIVHPRPMARELAVGAVVDAVPGRLV